MFKTKSVGLKGVVLSVIFCVGLAMHPVHADDDLGDLPPPPESGDSGLSPVDGGDLGGDASVGADLPPPPDPGAPADPSLDANAADATPPDAGTSEAPPSDLGTPPDDLSAPPSDLSDSSSSDESEVPSDSGESTDTAEAPSSDESSAPPSDTGLSDVPESVPSLAGPSDFSAGSELSGLSMKDRIKSKDLVLWLSLGPSYGTLTPKGSYVASSVAGASDSVGGLGYNAGIGFMANSVFQVSMDFTGTPKTKDTTVDQAMFGFGPRLGFLTLMGVFGVQQEPDQQKLFAYGARAGLDLVLSHGDHSRMSLGLAPEVYYITPQGVDGYQSVGVAVSLRLYGYENAF